MTSILSPSTMLMALIDAARSSVSLITTVVLVALLVMKEIANSAGGTRSRRLAQAVNIAIMPLAVVFALVVFVRIADALH
jgi:hypothetical protein